MDSAVILVKYLFNGVRVVDWSIGQRRPEFDVVLDATGGKH